jgi:hypothetical protein
MRSRCSGLGPEQRIWSSSTTPAKDAGSYQEMGPLRSSEDRFTPSSLMCFAGNELLI